MNEKAKILDEDLKDGLENLIAQLGTAQDKRHQSTFVNAKRLSATGVDELNALYRTDWVAGKVVDILPDDMTREWRSFKGDMDPKIVEALVEEEERLKLRSKFNLAHKWARLYGTAFIVMSIDDGQTPDKPLNFDTIKKGGLRHINVVDRHRISSHEQVPVSDPLNPNYGMPEKYRFSDTSVVIHHSRILRFDGVALPFDEFRRNNYFSDSVLDRLYESITNFTTASHGAASMVYEANVDIMKVKGLMNYLQSADGESLLRKRFTLASQMKSFNNMLLLDSEEDWDKKQNTFAGLPDLIDRFAQLLSAASDVPATRLLGISASGFNATGEGDLKNYYDKVRSLQNMVYKPLLDYFDNIMVKSMGVSDEDLSYEFNSLFQMSDSEKSDIELKRAQRDEIYVNMGAITEVVVAKELKQDDVYTNIDDDYIAELEELEEFGNGGDDTDFGEGNVGAEQEAEGGEKEEGEPGQESEEL